MNIEENKAKLLNDLDGSTMSDLESLIADTPAPAPKPVHKGRDVEMAPQHIIRLRSENVKRLTAVNIEPKGNVVRLTGDNGAGKSSVLDAIEMGLRGTRQAIEKPVRDGKDAAYVIIETEDLTITRQWSKGGKVTWLEITAKDGTKISAPQELLNRLIGSSLCFDPLEFARLPAKKQADILFKSFPAVDTETGEILDLEALAKNITAEEELRKKAGTVLEARLADWNRVKEFPTDAPATVDVKSLSASLRNLQDVKTRRANIENRMGYERQDIEKLKQQIATKEEYIADLQRQFNATPDPQPEIDLLAHQIEDASSANSKAEKAAERKRVAEQGADARKQHTKHDEQVKKLRKKRLDALANIDYPVAGLAVEDKGELSYNKNPLLQCCTSEQIKIGVALGAAANPTIRIAFIRDGSLLDETSMSTLQTLGEKYDMQFLVERVDDHSPAAVRIVDGSNIGAEDASGRPQSEEEFV